MSLAIVLPKLVSVHHNKSFALVNIKVSGFGIGSCHGSKDIGNAPKTCEIGTAFVDIYLLKLHSVDVDHSEMISLFVLIPKNITRRKVFMQHPFVVHVRCESRQSLGSFKGFAISFATHIV